MAGRRIENEEDAVDCLMRVECSGLELHEWVRRHGVDGRSLHCWRLNFERRGRQVPKAIPTQNVSRMVELVTHESEPPTDARYLIRSGIFEVEVCDDFDDDTLSRLLAVVATC